MLGHNTSFKQVFNFYILQDETRRSKRLKVNGLGKENTGRSKTIELNGAKKKVSVQLGLGSVHLKGGCT